MNFFVFGDDFANFKAFSSIDSWKLVIRAPYQDGQGHYLRIFATVILVPVGGQKKAAQRWLCYSTTVHFKEIVTPSFLGLMVSAPVRRSRDAWLVPLSQVKVFLLTLPMQVSELNPSKTEIGRL